MAYSQKYTLVSFINPIVVGTEYDMSDWPLHITLADVFAIDRAGTKIELKLTALTAKRSPFSVSADKEASLGVARVVLLDRNKDLLELHGQLIDLLEANGAIFNNPEFMREGYLPHSTIQKTGRLYDGDKVTISVLAFIDMFPDNDWQRRKVINLFTLGGK